MWGGVTPPNTMNVAGLYMQLFALFILISIHCEIACPNDFRDNYRTGSTKIDDGSTAPPYCTTRRSYGANRKISEKYQPEAKSQNIGGKQRRATLRWNLDDKLKVSNVNRFTGSFSL